MGALIGSKNSGSGLALHEFDVDGIAVVIVKNKHVVVAKIEVPEASVGGAGTREQQGIMAMNVKASGREGCRAAVIAQLSDGEERMGSEPRKNVGLAGCGGETRKGQGGNVARVKDGAVRDTDG
jgi:hypothetical protein